MFTSWVGFFGTVDGVTWSSVISSRIHLRTYSVIGSASHLLICPMISVSAKRFSSVSVLPSAHSYVTICNIRGTSNIKNIIPVTCSGCRSFKF